MLNPDAHLHPQLFGKKMDMAPIRDGYGEGLMRLGKTHEQVVVLCADLTESTRSQQFAEAFPDRFFEVGVAEQNLATVAAGLGVSGKIPFISSYATFSPGRNYEQIRTTCAYNDSNVKIIGSHAGVSVGADGATHQATEDIAIMRVMPNMRVFVPCDAVEARKITESIADMWGPCYVRLAREKSPVITTDKTPCQPGKALEFWKSDHPDVAIIACGALVYQALVAAKELWSDDKLKTVVINCPSIKPLDEHLIKEYLNVCKAVVTVEEHQIVGGLGGAVAELAGRYRPVPIEYIGMHDEFGQSGSPDDLITHYEMDTKAIIRAVKKVLKRKKSSL